MASRASDPSPALPVTHDHRLLNATSLAVHAALRDTTAGGNGHLPEAMRQLCAEARRLQVRPEALIVMFKTTWRAHTDHYTLSREDASRLLDQVISTCIKEYYGPTSSPGDGYRATT
jgi:hypothetical protein